MQLNLDDTGGAKELAMHRLGVAKEDLEAAQTMPAIMMIFILFLLMRQRSS